MTVPRRYQMAGVVVLLVFAVKAAWHLGDASLWTDEGWDVSVASRPWHDMWAALAAGSVHPPLFAVTLWGWMRLLGTDQATALRLLDWMCSVGTVAAMLRWGPRLVGDAPALVGAALAALSAELLLLTQEIRLYPMSMLFYTLGSLSIGRALATRQRRDVVWMTVFMGLALGTDVWGVDLLVTAWILVVWKRRSLTGFPWRLFLVGQALFLVALGAGAFFLASRPHAVQPFNSPRGAFAYVMVLAEFAVGHTHSALQPALPALLLCLPLAVGCWHLARQEGTALLLAAALPWGTVAAIMAVTGLDVVNPRRLAVVLPLTFLFCGVGLVQLWRHRAGQAMATVLCLALAAYNAQSTWNWFCDPTYQRQNWRDACAYVRQHSTPQDLVVLQNGYCNYVFHYYLRDALPVLTPGANTEDVAAIAAEYPRVWYVSCEAYQEDPNLAVVHWLLQHMDADPPVVFPNTPQPDSNIVVMAFHQKEEHGH